MPALLPEMVGLAVVVMVRVPIMDSQMVQQILEAAEEGEVNQLLPAQQAAAELLFCAGLLLLHLLPWALD